MVFTARPKVERKESEYWMLSFVENYSTFPTLWRCWYSKNTFNRREHQPQLESVLKYPPALRAPNFAYHCGNAHSLCSFKLLRFLRLQVCNMYARFCCGRAHSPLAMHASVPCSLHRRLAAAFIHLPSVHGGNRRGVVTDIWCSGVITCILPCIY